MRKGKPFYENSDDGSRFSDSVRDCAFLGTFAQGSIWGRCISGGIDGHPDPLFKRESGFICLWADGFTGAGDFRPSLESGC